jgi:uncharacterized cupin superfamily protein
LGRPGHLAVGQRVSRKDGRELGTVIKINGKIKVKWDSGQTSYYRHGDRANIRLGKLPQV